MKFGPYSSSCFLQRGSSFFSARSPSLMSFSADFCIGSASAFLAFSNASLPFSTTSRNGKKDEPLYVLVHGEPCGSSNRQTSGEDSSALGCPSRAICDDEIEG